MKVDHIGVAVDNLDDAVEKFKLLCPDINVHFEESKDGTMTVAFLEFENIKVELMKPHGEDGAVAKFMLKHGEGLHHMAVEVKDITQSIDDAKGSNIRVTNDTPREGSGGYMISFVHPKDFHGVMIEFCQKKK